ncbi:regulatory protein, MarR [Novosphingobium nitrogenifigens DSM 19370]|uniref:Regulatory protein, MarR n=1 Tax=Novosphingobium nitrogenifigens DSM 19370 TaxID=983920 RepID=F1Z8Q8_9SPHN|nr:winged helix DNA-binding protein [Novosphingobium nitrogenifigens]EGD58967.1 regulatory protein, MarR [Novosphingobium nitrogenifigens DSM 19370]
MDVRIDFDARALRLAKSQYDARRRRDAAVGVPGLFGEPAWDILLDVFIAQKSRQELQVSSVCIEAGVPSTTILRWLSRLEQEGLIYRASDNVDGRRRFVRLTDAGEELMHRVIAAIGPND